MVGQRRQGGDEPVDVVCAAAESQAGAYCGPGRVEPGQQRVSAEAAVPHADAVLSGQVLRDQRRGPAVDGEADDLVVFAAVPVWRSFARTVRVPRSYMYKPPLTA
jgi:hypothetical protein